MSKMSDLAIEVEELLLSGYSADNVAEIVGVPVDWVLGVQDAIEDDFYNGERL